MKKITMLLFMDTKMPMKYIIKEIGKNLGPADETIYLDGKLVTAP